MKIPKGIRKKLQRKGFDDDLITLAGQLHGSGFRPMVDAISKVLTPSENDTPPENSPLPRSQAEINKIQELSEYINDKKMSNSLPGMLEEEAVQELLPDDENAPSASKARKLIASVREIAREHTEALQMATRGSMSGYRLKIAKLKVRVQTIMEQAKDMYEVLKDMAGDDKNPNDPISRGVSFARTLAEKLETLSDMMKDPDITPEGKGSPNK